MVGKTDVGNKEKRRQRFMTFCAGAASGHGVSNLGLIFHGRSQYVFGNNELRQHNEEHIREPFI